MNEPLAISRLGIEDLLQIAKTAAARLAQVRGIAIAPGDTKTPPVFTTAQLCGLTGLDRQQIQYRVSKGDLPAGTKRKPGSRREFSLKELRAWTSNSLNAPRRPPGAPACVITCANFKGGSCKTTTTLTLAQGLSLRGHDRIAVIDLDPQGTLTQFFSILPDSEVDDEGTVAPICYGDRDFIEDEMIRSTYWDGIDLVPASPALFGAEFVLPARQVRNPSFEFWSVLDRAIERMRQQYDFILIDSSPSLSYLTINALWAANGLIVPLPPDNPAYSSLAQFWNLFSDIANGVDQRLDIHKEFDFIHILLSRVDSSKTATAVVRKWIASTYGDLVMPIEIPETSVAHTTALKYQTVYDVSRYTGSDQAYKRARQAYDRAVELVEESAAMAWQRTVG